MHHRGLPSTAVMPFEENRYLLASDFDQTLSFNDSRMVLSEMLGISGFEERCAGLSRTHLVQQGAELANLLLHCGLPLGRVRRRHRRPAGAGGKHPRGGRGRQPAISSGNKRPLSRAKLDPSAHRQPGPYGPGYPIGAVLRTAGAPFAMWSHCPSQAQGSELCGQ